MEFGISNLLLYQPTFLDTTMDEQEKSNPNSVEAETVEVGDIRYIN